MDNNYKPGGGGKLQPYVPAGNGEKSGEYTDKKSESRKTQHSYKNCKIVNKRRRCNFFGSDLVKRVDYYYLYKQGRSIPKSFDCNSVIKREINGFIVSERYYNDKGDVYLDIDYTCHGNPKTHPIVPHIHRWVKDQNGKLQRMPWEEFR